MNRKKLLNKAVNAAAGKMGIDGKMPDKVDVNFTKKLKASGFLGVILAITVFIFSTSAWLYNSIPKTATSIGSAFGKLTGLAAGSFQAGLDVPDSQSIFAKGKSEEEIKTAVETFAHECGKLEVMRCIIPFATLENSDDAYYSLSGYTAEALCTVDLSEAKFEGNTLTVHAIDIDLSMNEESETFAEYTAAESENSQTSFTASRASDVSSKEEALAALKEDSAFMDSLHTHAEGKIKTLLKAILGEETEINISWKEEEPEYDAEEESDTDF